MDDPNTPRDAVAPEIVAFYATSPEPDRLAGGPFRLEAARTRAILEQVLPPPPAVVLDVGGGAGAYALWLADRGYEVHLVDLSPRLVDEALARSRAATRPIASCAVGDARALDRADDSADALLMLGPLYHLQARQDRLRALGEARRILVPGGVLCAAAISRWVTALGGTVFGIPADPAFARILAADLRDGQHRNDTGNPAYFTTAYFHRPEDLLREVQEAGFGEAEVRGIEGPGWLAGNFDELWNAPATRALLLTMAAACEHEPSVLAVSAHLLAVARRP